MTAERNYKQNPLSDDEELKRDLASAAFNRALTPAQKKIYLEILLSESFNKEALTVTYKIPEGASTEDVDAALKALDASRSPWLKIMLCREFPRDPAIIDKADKALMEEYATEKGIENLPHVQRTLGISHKARRP